MSIRFLRKYAKLLVVVYTFLSYVYAFLMSNSNKYEFNIWNIMKFTFACSFHAINMEIQKIVPGKVRKFELEILVDMTTCKSFSLHIGLKYLLFINDSIYVQSYTI